MNVKELMDELSKLPGHLEVYIPNSRQLWNLEKVEYVVEEGDNTVELRGKNG
jgi:hypothetical protein